MNWIITLTRNNLSLTKEAVASFLAQDIGGVELLVIDNGSSDGTGEWLRSRDNIHAMFFNPPRSVAASWNAGLSYMFDELHRPYVLVVNNDTVLRPDTYRHLAADGGPFVTAVGSRDRRKINPPYETPDPAKKRPHPDFSCYLIRRECWRKVGRFDENFKVGYCEDACYHIRMHRAGIHACCLELPFYHVASGTAKGASDAERQMIHEQANRNREYFKQKYGVAIGSPEYYALFGHGAPESD